MRTPTALLVVLLLLVASLGVPSTAAATEPVRSRAVTLESWDGTILAGTLYWIPSTVKTPAPAILMTHGWAGSKGDLVDEARWLARLGHIVLAYDSRGFGHSGGTVGLNGPDEWADVSAWVTWLARLQGADDPKVLLDDPATDDPRIGMYGYSYGGAIQLLAAAHDPRIDALVPDITWSDLGHSLAPNGVVKRGWVDLLFWSGTFASSGVAQGDPSPTGMDERLRQWYLQSLQTGRLPPDAIEALAERSPIHHLENVSAHVFLTQGLMDTLFLPDEAVATHAVLAARDDAETHLLFHPAGHGHALASGETRHVRAEIERFYGRHLFGAEGPSVAAVQWYDAQARTWWEAGSWPSGAVAVAAVPSSSEAGVVTLVQAPAATSHTEAQELEGMLIKTATDTPLPTALRIPFPTTAPAALVGVALLSLEVTPQVDDLTLFFSLVDVGPHSERVVGNQVAALRVEGNNGESVALEVPLVTVAHTLQVGHRLEVRVTTSDTGYLGGREPGTVAIDTGGAILAVPLFDRVRAVHGDGTEPDGGTETQRSPGVGLLFVVALLALVRPWRRDLAR